MPESSLDPKALAERIAAARKAAGKTQEEVVAMNLTKEFDAKSARPGGFITPVTFVQRAYVDLKRTVK